MQEFSARHEIGDGWPHAFIGIGGHISGALNHQFVDKHGDSFSCMVTQQSATLIYRNMVFPSGTVFRAVNG